MRWRRSSAVRGLSKSVAGDEMPSEWRVMGRPRPRRYWPGAQVHRHQPAAEARAPEQGARHDARAAADVEDGPGAGERQAVEVRVAHPGEGGLAAAELEPLAERRE